MKIDTSIHPSTLVIFKLCGPVLFERAAERAPEVLKKNQGGLAWAQKEEHEGPIKYLN